mmetsp:Transcript_44572/g.103027  ORF Transcript_44572/g.103027 Transcript_44572/m.103027 type:complete len:268 (+) Transcript_44572:729-1532(+)
MHPHAARQPPLQDRPLTLHAPHELSSTGAWWVRSTVDEVVVSRQRLPGHVLKTQLARFGNLCVADGHGRRLHHHSGGLFNLATTRARPCVRGSALARRTSACASILFSGLPSGSGTLLSGLVPGCVPLLLAQKLHRRCPRSLHRLYVAATCGASFCLCRGLRRGILRLCHAAFVLITDPVKLARAVQRYRAIQPAHAHGTGVQGRDLPHTRSAAALIGVCGFLPIATSDDSVTQAIAVLGINLQVKSAPLLLLAWAALVQPTHAHHP